MYVFGAKVVLELVWLYYHQCLRRLGTLETYPEGAKKSH